MSKKYPNNNTIEDTIANSDEITSFETSTSKVVQEPAESIEAEGNLHLEGFDDGIHPLYDGTTNDNEKEDSKRRIELDTLEKNDKELGMGECRKLLKKT